MKEPAWVLLTTSPNAFSPRLDLLVEAANPGFSETVQSVVARGEELLQHPTILLSARQLAAALLAVDPAFSVDEYSSMEYGGMLRKLQGRFLLLRKEERMTAVEFQIRQNNVFNTIYLSGKSVEARTWLDARNP